ncbi:unnamed protein product, partial [Nesidiocoris tenuis]
FFSHWSKWAALLLRLNISLQGSPYIFQRECGEVAFRTTDNKTRYAQFFWHRGAITPNSKGSNGT